MTQQLPFDSESLYACNQLLFSDGNSYFNAQTSQVEYLEELQGWSFTGKENGGHMLFNGDGLLVFDLATKQTVARWPFFEDRSTWLFKMGSIVYRGAGFLSCYNYMTNSHKWQLDFKEILDGRDIQTVSNVVSIGDKLYCWLYDDKHPANNLTCCIEISSGRILNIVDGFGGYLQQFNGHFIGAASGKRAAILDTRSGETRQYDLSSALSQENIGINGKMNVFTENGYLFFAGSMPSKNKTGVIDLHTQTLLWQDALDIQNNQYNLNQTITAIKVCNDRLYLLGSDDVLHVYAFRS